MTADRAALVEKANSAYFRVGIPDTPNARMAAAISIIRAEVLEEAARVAETCRHGTEAAAIRALKGGA